MSAKKVAVPFPDPNSPGGVKMIEGNEVPITESTERWTELHLEDGAIIRVKPNVLSAIRVDGQYDQDGNPMYALKGSQTMTIVSVPDHLRKGSKETKIQ
jgi:hypothetical protein